MDHIPLPVNAAGERESPWIRVLDLFSLEDNRKDLAIIRCDVRNIQLSEEDTSEPYEALSYAWMDEDPSVPIVLSGRNKSVGPNLAAALRHLQLENRKRTLWIDQLCIDQTNNDEKADQVRHMRKIYSKCTQCLVWLNEIPDDKGFTDTDAEAALEILTYMSKNYKIETPPEPACLLDSDASSRAMQAMRYITGIENPWWTRVWTVQEVALPKTITVVWGKLSLPWSTLHGASQTWTGKNGRQFPPLIADLYDESRQNEKTLSRIMTEVIWLEIAREGYDEPLDLWKPWRRRMTTEPRDNVYGLMGLVNQPEKLPLVERCDYNVPVADVFAMLTVDLIVAEEGLRPLILDVRLDKEQATPGVARWAMDMTGDGKYDTAWYYLHGYEYYEADRGLTPEPWEKVRELAMIGDQRTLSLKGVEVDRIVDSIAGLEYTEADQEEDQPLFETLKNWAEYYRTMAEEGKIASETGEEVDMVQFARLILGDLIRDGEQWVDRIATNEDEQELLEYLETEECSFECFHTAVGMIRNKRLFVTRKGRVGLGHAETETGDEVWILAGGNIPFTLRRRVNGDDDMNGSSVLCERDFVDHCYVQGIMQGEALEDGFDSDSDVKHVRIY